MRLLEEKIRQEGEVRPGDVLKVDSFLNHQIDVDLLDAMGAEFHRLFAGEQIDRILTIEASGIAIAVAAARHFRVPVVFAKKNKSSNVGDAVYSVMVHSFTRNKDVEVIVSRSYLKEGERVLILDDFLANGCAAEGLAAIVREAGAVPAGVGIVIEKGQMPGRARLEEQGLHVESLAIVESMDAETGEIVFREQENE